MRTPTTTLDQRYSESGTAPTDWEETRRALEASELYWLTTIRPDGRPHVTPLVAVWLDEALHFGTGAGEQKATNLRSNSHVVLTTGCNDWDRGFDVVVEGQATRVTERPVLERLAEAWRTKWDGRWQFQVREDCLVHADGDEGVLVFSVSPAQVLVFAKGTFSHTRHQF